MRFRFGWRKEQNVQQLINEEMKEEFQLEESLDLTPVDNNLDVIVVNGQPEQEVAMTTRVIFFGEQEEIGNLYSLFLRSKGYEVHHFPAPLTCALIMQEKCTCPRDHVCADIVIAEMNMDGMTGLELFRQQAEKGCRALPNNKAIISSNFTNKQEYEAKALGCKILRKPFRLLDIMEWIKQCEKNIPPNRKLTPLEELLEAA